MRTKRGRAGLGLTKFFFGGGGGGFVVKRVGGWTLEKNLGGGGRLRG